MKNNDVPCHWDEEANNNVRICDLKEEARRRDARRLASFREAA